MAGKRVFALAAAVALLLGLLFFFHSSGAAANQANTPLGFERLFSDSFMHRFTVRITRTEWEGLISDMKEYKEAYGNMRTGNYRHADLVYEDKYGTAEIINVGFRTHGCSSREIPEIEEGFNNASFAIKFDETFGLSETDPGYSALKERDFFGLDRLLVKWNFWQDESYIHEVYCYEKLAEAGIPAPFASLAMLVIEIDGKPVNFGIYTIAEPIDKKFLTRRFGKALNDGNLYKCGWINKPATLASLPADVGVGDWKNGVAYSYELKTNKSSPNTGDLEDFIKNINSLGDAELTAYIDDHFDTDGFLRVLAMNVLLGNPDDYRSLGNNYYLYFNSGKVIFIPYDYSENLGSGWCGGKFWSREGIASADIYEWRNLNTPVLKKDVPHPLVDRLLANNTYRKRYEYYLKYFIQSGLFSWRSFKDKYDALYALYGDYALSDTISGEVMRLTNEEWYFETKIGSVMEQVGEK